MKNALKRWRTAKKAFAKNSTYENAVELQVATRNLLVAKRKNLTLIAGDKL